MAAGTGSAPGGNRRRPENLTPLSNSPTVGRFAMTNHLLRKADTLAPTTNHPKLKAFLPQNLWPWIWNYLKNAFTPRYRFPDYTGSGGTGVYPIRPAPGASAIRISIAGDWATGTDEAYQIINLMTDSKPDFTIHLGDVYYVGDTPEVEENWLGEPRNGYDGVKWQPGTQGSFSLNGNHEMYANGKPYFTKLLPTLGMTAGPAGQVASFFSLETDYWRVLALDTGYNSVGIPLLSMIPGLNSIPFIGGDCHLEGKLIDWLKTEVRPQERPKATLLLSHHQCFTAFTDKAYTKAAKQLAGFFKGQEVVWLWGHEHRLGIYDRHAADGGMTMYGRCLGHGGMPVDLGTPDPKKAPLLWYDSRSHPLPGGDPVGENGFVTATIEDRALTLEYRDVANNQMLVEEFTPAANGALSYRVVRNSGILRAP